MSSTNYTVMYTQGLLESGGRDTIRYRDTGIRLSDRTGTDWYILVRQGLKPGKTVLLVNVSKPTERLVEKGRILPEGWRYEGTKTRNQIEAHGEFPRRFAAGLPYRNWIAYESDMISIQGHSYDMLRECNKVVKNIIKKIEAKK